MLTDFETTLMGVLIDTCGLSPEQVSDILKEKERSTDSIATVVTRMGLVSSHRLANLIAQYFELPLVAPTFDPSVALELLWEPIDFILDRNLIPIYIDGESLVVVGDCVPPPDIRRELEELFGLDVSLRICDSESLVAALRKLRADLSNIKELGPADCDHDKERFLRFCRAGWSATVAERFAGGVVRYQYAPETATGGPIVSKTIDLLHESEPPEMVELLVGKSMSCEVTPEMDLRELVGGFLSCIQHFQGELKEAIFELRLAQLILDDDSSAE
jgi:hypothetical protein